MKKINWLKQYINPIGKFYMSEIYFYAIISVYEIRLLNVATSIKFVNIFTIRPFKRN
jgi:hypothetical protein